MGVVPAFQVLENRKLGLRLGSKPMTIQQLPFQGGEKAFAQSVVEAVTDRSHRRTYLGLATALSEGQGRILTAVTGVHWRQTT